MQILERVGFERHASLQHCIEKDSKGPQIDVEATVAVVCDYLRRKVRWRPALLFDHLVLGDESTDPEVTNFDAPVRVHEDVVQLDVSVQHATTVAVGQTVHYLFENLLSRHFIQVLFTFDKLEQISSTSILHDK